jgi:hypothetical protein
MKRIVFLIMGGAVTFNAWAALSTVTGSLSTPSNEGLISGGITWSEDKEGLTIFWEVSQMEDYTWHYQYTFANGDGNPLKMLVSYFIISVSENLTCSDVFNFGGDAEDYELKTFGPGPSAPGFPEDQTIWGLKIELGGEQLTAEFSSNRAPMWGDFYAKDGGNPKNYAYNKDLGVEVANLHDYQNAPADEYGNSLFKVLVPNTIPESAPEPASLSMLALGSLLLIKRRSY